MQLHDLRPAEGSTKKRKRVGRGTGSGKGKTSTRGTKGQNSRAGGGVSPWFEGGQLPLIRRLPKLRGFTNRFKVHYTPVNLDVLERLFASTSDVTPETLMAVGVLSSIKHPVVVLGRGEVAKVLHLKVHRISATARQMVEAAGGSVEILPVVVNKNRPRS